MTVWIVPLASVFIAGLSVGVPWLIALSGSVVVVAVASMVAWAIRHEADARRLRATSVLESER